MAEMILTVEMVETWHGDSLYHLPGGRGRQRQCLRQPAVTSSTIRTPASLRSENARLHLGTGDRDQIGITDQLQRNKHGGLSRRSPLTVGAHLKTQEFEQKPVGRVGGEPPGRH